MDIGMGSHPAQCPGRGACIRTQCLERSFHFLRKCCQRTTFDRLHDHHGNTQLLSQCIPLITCLDVTVYVVILDLAEIPRTACQDLFKHFIIVVEGETDIADLSFLPHSLYKGKNIQIFYCLPSFFIQSMQKIKIHMIHTQTLQLIIKDSLYIFFFLQLPDRQLGCQIERISVILFQHPADKGFAVAIMIRVSRINISNTCLDGCIQHFLCFHLIDLSLRCLRKTHAAKT